MFCKSKFMQMTLILFLTASVVNAGGSALGTNYNVTPGESVQGPQPQCYPIYNQSLPGAPDDIVTFDGIPEQIRTLVNGAVPSVIEQENQTGPNEYQLSIQLSTPNGTRLFPGGLQAPNQQPLTSACFYVGSQVPLQYDGPKQVTNATIVFTVNGSPVAGPFDVTSFFSNPVWDGTFAAVLPGAAGSPINGVSLDFRVVILGCTSDAECDDNDPCTIDTCVNFVCHHTPVADPCCGVNCDDGICETIDTCVNGICHHDLIDCDDGDCCTIDECVGGVCTHTHVRDRVPTQHAARRAFHKAHAACLALGGSGCGGGGGGAPPSLPTLDDPWTTHPACDGETKWRIGLDPGDPPIPAGFFGTGSEAFAGTIVFHGESLGIPGLADADTIIRRSADPFHRSDPPSATPVTVGLELVQLNLVSCTPITVIINGSPTMWDVRAGVSACAPPSGSLTATKTHCNGGTYTYSLHVQQKATFTRVGNPTEVHVLDTGCIGSAWAFDDLQWVTPTPWVHDFDPDLPLRVNYASAFHTGVPVDAATTVCGDYDQDDQCDADDFKTFLRSYGHVAFEPEYLPYTDYDADGDTDEADYHEWRSCRRCFVGDPNARPPAPLPLGDMNGDGNIRGNDIAALVACMLSGGPACAPADIDQNGTVDLRDVPGIVLLLLELN
jgi:hypothetical protein